jgi:hypothetical protein
LAWGKDESKIGGDIEAHAENDRKGSYMQCLDVYIYFSLIP